jgi:hypothetical protein
MGLSPNFVEVSVGKDSNGQGVITVRGKTDTEPNRVEAIYVALGHGEDLVTPRSGAGADAPARLKPDSELDTAAKVTRPSAAAWSVKIRQPEREISVDEKVLAVGVALRTSKPKVIFWQETVTTKKAG